MKVLITRRLPKDIVQKITERHDVVGHFEDEPMSPEKLKEAVAGCHGILCTISDTIDADLLDTSPRLRIVANFGVGFDNIDVAAATARGILVTNTPGVLTNATADLAMALILSVGRRVVEGDRMLREGRFRFWAPFHFLGRDISGKTLGIVGMGRIGQAVARRAAGFGMKMLYHSRRRLESEREASLGADYVSLDTLLSQSDYISLHVPLTNETRHLISAREFSIMKSDTYLINTARGPVIDENALVDALRRGLIAGAGLDVYENEPAVSPGLCELNNVVLLPHVGSATVETRCKMASMAAENLLAGMAGQLPPNCINPEAVNGGLFISEP